MVGLLACSQSDDGQETLQNSLSFSFPLSLHVYTDTYILIYIRIHTYTHYIFDLFSSVFTSFMQVFPRRAHSEAASHEMVPGEADCTAYITYISPSEAGRVTAGVIHHLTRRRTSASTNQSVYTFV